MTDKITTVPNGGNQCRFRATVENIEADGVVFAAGDTCFCEEDGSLWKVSLDLIWFEM